MSRQNRPRKRTAAWRRRKLWLVSSTGVALDGFDLFSIGVALALMRLDPSFATDSFGVSAAAVVGAAVAGAIIGAGVSGPLIDRFGRIHALIGSASFLLIFCIASALAGSLLQLIIFRALMGVGIGAMYPVSATIVAETSKRGQRGRQVGSTIAFQAVGMVLGAIGSLVVLSVVEPTSAWRWVLALGAPPALAMIIIAPSLTPSPRWLAAKGRVEEAREAARKLGLHFKPEKQVPALENRFRFLELFTRKNARKTVLACIPWALMDIATYGVGIFTPVILLQESAREASHIAKGANSVAHMIANERSMLEATTVLDLLLLIGFVIGITLVDKVGRIRLQTLGFVGMAVGLGILAFAGTGENSIVALVFVGFAVFNLSMNAGPNTTTYILPAEVFPTHLRATGHGFAAACAKSGALAGTIALPILIEHLGLTIGLGIVMLCCLLGAVVTLLARIETTKISLEKVDTRVH